MNDEYQPGLTELRLNVKALQAQNQSLSQEVHKLMSQVDAEQTHRQKLTNELSELRTILSGLQAKLFENGIR